MHIAAAASRATTILKKNPRLFCRVLIAKLNTTRPMPALPALKRIADVVFEFDLNRYRGTAPMYFGSYALPIVETMKRLLRPGDVFLDVGANIGYLAAIAASLVGPAGQVHCFEPVPEYFDRLQKLVTLNPEYDIRVNSHAAGEAPGACTIYVTREPGQNTMVPAYKSGPEIVETMEVPVIRLDSYLKEQAIERVAVIKIDAEGFEMPILKGLEGYFQNSSRRPAIICEIAPRAYPLMGRKVSELAAYMSRYGYRARDLIDGTTPVNLEAIHHVDDVLFLASASACASASA
jgi:FkbM family methyltransferase